MSPLLSWRRRLIAGALVAPPFFALAARYAAGRGWLSREAAAVTASSLFGLLLAGGIAWIVAQLRRAEAQRERLSKEMSLSHERFVLAVEGSSDGLWDWNVVTGEVYFSPRWLGMLGYGERELPHSFATWEGLMHPDDRERALAMVTDYHDGRIPVYELEHRLRHKDGSYRWVLSRGALLWGPFGRPLRMSGSHTDITERKRAEEALRESEERFRQVAENIREVFWLTNVDLTEVVYISPGFEHVWGRTCRELYDSPRLWLEMLHPEDRERAHAAFPRLAQGTFDELYRIVRPDGQTRWIRDRAFPVRDASGRIYRHAGLAEDVTERKAAEEALRESESRFRQVTENIREVFWLSDVNKDEVIYVSPGYELVWGRSVKSLHAAPLDWLDAIHPEDRERVITAARSKQVTGEYDEVYRIRRPDGALRWIRDRASPVKDESGKVCRIAGLAEDITDRLRLEEELRAARDQALASDRAKSVFLANVSHELRTPLNAVIGMNELLLESPLTEEQKERAAVARDAGRGLLMLIDDILDFARLEAGRLTLDLTDFDPREVLAEVDRLLRYKAAEKRLGFEVRVDASVPAALVGDPARLRQVLLNFVGNALKFTEKGLVSVVADCPRRDDQEAVLRLRVSDTGIGIPSDVLPRLFQPFSQGDAGTTRRYGGTGLGLVISRQIAEVMGGTVEARSVPGEGSTFTFQAPLPLSTRVSPAARPACREDVRGLRVLLVEDNAVNRRVALSQLAALGCVTDVAEDGAQALEAFARSRYDVALMDCAMPVMDGYAAVEELRRREGRGPRTPVIALTAGARAEDRARCLEAGMDDHLSKPASIDELAAALSRWGGPVDAAALERASALVGEEAPRWRAAYLEDAARLLAEMTAAAAAGDGAALKRAAHTLKGASSALGAKRLAALCARVETGGEPDPDELAKELDLVRERLGS